MFHLTRLSGKRDHPPRSETYVGVPPGGTKPQGQVAHGRFPVVAVGIAPVQPRRNQRVSEAEGRALEGVRDPRMHLLLVSLVGGNPLAQESGEVFVEDYVLENG